MPSPCNISSAVKILSPRIAEVYLVVIVTFKKKGLLGEYTDLISLDDITIVRIRRIMDNGYMNDYEE
jgi:hypothetical protein